MCSVCIFLKVVSYYDLSFLSMSVMGFQKKRLDGDGWVGEWWGDLYAVLFWIFGIILTLPSPLSMLDLTTPYQIFAGLHSALKH